MKIYKLDNGQFSVGVKYKNATNEFDKTEEEVLRLRKGCKLLDSGEIEETEEYLSYIEKEQEETAEKEILMEYSKIKPYEIVSVVLQLLKEIYTALPTTTKDKINTEAVEKYTDLKNKIDTILNS